MRPSASNMQRPCDMFSIALSSRTSCCCSWPFERRSIMAAISEMPRMANAAAAVKKESAAGEISIPSTTRGGSGTRVAARGDDERQCGEYASEQDGCSDDTGRPRDARRELQRQHAGVVHRGDTDT